MGAKYTQAQHSATNKYRSSKGRIELTMSIELRDKVKMAAADKGISTNQYIVEAIEERIRKG